MTHVFTTYFANIKSEYPMDITPISISLFPPKGWNMCSYPPLFPPKELLSDIKHGKITDRDYITHYKKHVLDKLNPQQVYDEITKLVYPYTPCLVCYEKPTKGFYCHRQIVSKWLNEHGFETKELNELDCEDTCETPLF